MNLDNTTHLSCVKILIRLARTSREVAERILTYSNLVKFLINQFTKVGTAGESKQWRTISVNIFKKIYGFRYKFSKPEDQHIHVETVSNILFVWRSFR